MASILTEMLIIDQIQNKLGEVKFGNDVQTPLKASKSMRLSLKKNMIPDVETERSVT